MKDLVSVTNVVMLSLSLIIVAGIFFADLPWIATLCVSLAASVALWMTPSTPARSLAQLIRDLGRAPVPVAARSQRVPPSPQANL